VEPFFSRSGLGLPVVAPGDQRRQRHQDRFGAAARLQAEQRAAVVDKVELDVAAAAELLEGPLLQREGFALAALGDWQVRLQKVVAAVADKGEESIDIALEVVEEDAA